ncbi:hypothetical protein F5B22DRAFT_612077, partial [Xylaria bambusicola]|uniref:uncharacterized protein n=1 Tax=Xylaria bambusicola TaxID=326684 RepID=UPI0020088F50
MYHQFTQHGIMHGNPKLHNFIRTEHGVMAINLEFSHLLPNDITNKHELASLIDEIGAVINVTSLVQAKSHLFQTSMPMMGGRSRLTDDNH